MIFLLIFSYVILCNFAPLYKFPLDTCIPIGTGKYYDDSCDNSSLDDSINSTSSFLDENILNLTTSGSYVLRRCGRPSFFEYLLSVWIATLVCEEIRQVIYSNKKIYRVCFVYTFICHICYSG